MSSLMYFLVMFLKLIEQKLAHHIAYRKTGSGMVHFTFVINVPLYMSCGIMWLGEHIELWKASTVNLILAEQTTSPNYTSNRFGTANMAPPLFLYHRKI